jgi:FtsH ternary system-associated peptide
MRAYHFQNEDELQIALTAGLIPADLQAEPAHWTREADGSLVVAPDRAVPARAEVSLRAAGVGVQARNAQLERRASVWAEIVAARRLESWEPGSGAVLFALPDDRSPLELAAELLRLGCDRLELAFRDDETDRQAAAGARELEAHAVPRALLRAIDPPYYSVTCAFDRPGGLRAFAPSPPGQDAVWTEIGWKHPLVQGIRPAAGRLLLVPGDAPWQRLANGPWTDVYQMLDLVLPGAPVRLPAAAPSRRIAVPLRLARSPRDQAPQLWVLRHDAVATIEALLQTLPEEVVARLLFAVGGANDEPIVVLRARAGPRPPELVVRGEAYAQLQTIGNLFAPAGSVVEPPLRREKLREILAPSADELCWLAPLEPAGAGAFRVERIAEAAFSPLTDWVEYIIDTHAPALVPWIRSAVFDFEAFEAIGDETGLASSVASAHDRGARGGGGEGRTRETRAARELAPDRPRSPAKTPKPADAAERFENLPPDGSELRVPSQLERRLAELERGYLESTAAIDAPGRGLAWSEMADLHTSLAHPREAGLCYTRALWELDPDAARGVARDWVAAEVRLLRGAVAASEPAPAAGGLIGGLVEMRTPSRDQVRAVASFVVGMALAVPGTSAPPAAADLHRIHVWLDQNDDNLDIRSLWLARTALARLVGGDRLSLARTRDRVLAKLARGLSLERDVPAFLRFLGGGGTRAADAAALDQLAERLEALLVRYDRTARKVSLTEAPPALTRAYVDLVLAYGFARLGRAERAHALRAHAAGTVDVADPVHGFLVRAYGARVEQALEGLPPETPLPPAVAGELDTLEKFARYKVDRLRQASTILEPQERLDAVDAFSKGARDPRGEEFAGMRSISDLGVLARAVADLLVRASASADAHDRARLFDGLMDFFPLIPEAQAVPGLRTILGRLGDIPPARRAPLLEEALVLAGYFGREDLVKATFASLKAVLAMLGSEQAAEVAAVLGGCLRGLRRVGLGDQAAELFTAAASAVTGKGIDAVVGRLHLAGAMAALGRMDAAGPILEEARVLLREKSLLMLDRLKLVRAMALALSHTPREHAMTELGRLAEQLPLITDNYNTNSHFCLSVIQFVESLVLGYASEDLTLGELGRRWLEEDEYLVRRRVHRDLQGEAP